MPEPVSKKVRFAERVEKQTLMVLLLQIHGVYQQQFEQVDESTQDSSKRQKVTHGAGVELEGLVMESERDRLQRCSDCDFLMQLKQNADVYLDGIFLQLSHEERNCEERVDAVRCASIGPCGGSVSKSWECTFCPRIRSHTWISV